MMHISTWRYQLNALIARTTFPSGEKLVEKENLHVEIRSSSNTHATSSSGSVESEHLGGTAAIFSPAKYHHLR
jgi:hypothetical protein